MHAGGNLVQTLIPSSTGATTGVTQLAPNSTEPCTAKLAGVIRWNNALHPGTFEGCDGKNWIGLLAVGRYQFSCSPNSCFAVDTRTGAGYTTPKGGDAGARGAWDAVLPAINPTGTTIGRYQVACAPNGCMVMDAANGARYAPIEKSGWVMAGPGIEP